MTNEDSALTSSDECIQLTVCDLDKAQFKRLDQFLVHSLTDKSRSTIQSLFKSGKITSDQANLELKKMPPAGTIIQIKTPPPQAAEAIAQNIPLEILFEDEHLIIVNKEAGMVTHPAPGNWEGTLVNAILHHCQDLQGVGDQKRPGIVHRLDKGTSGVMVIAKNQKCHQGLVELFSTHDITRRYEALIIGGKKMAIAGKCESKIGRHPQNRLKMAINVKGGKNAITHYKVLDKFQNSTHLELKLETGRTHQIRVHCSQILNLPILGDTTYGNPKQQLTRLTPELSSLIYEYPYPFLHAKELGFIHPITGEDMHFTSEPPPLFREYLKIARRQRDELTS